MSALSDIFAAVRLQLDGTGFEAQATALADSQGKNVGDRMSQQLNAKLKQAVLGTAGALAGLSFATAINGATTLNQLAGEYQVQTGANATEARAFQGTLNDLFKTSHQGYDEIAQTLIGLKTHFDLSGEAAKVMGANILTFAEVAGGTGSDAVERLNSLVKTGVIAESDMAATMDKLTLAHQNWGININETLDSLAKFAPAMNALGMSTDDAIGWMSIFNKAGVDAQRVTMGFNTAIKKVKTPEEFKQLVATIASTPDDFTRAKLASELFGQRAGSALANMLRPGSQSVADMAKIIGTDYTGAVAAAGKANDSTFSGRAILMLHEFQGKLAEVGASMGDLLTVAAILGPGLTRAVFSGLGGLASLLLPKIAEQLGLTLPAWIAAGTAEGAAAGTAAGTAEAAAVAAAGPEVAAGVAAQGAEVGTAAATVGGSAGGAFVGGMVAVIGGAAAGLALQGAMQDAWKYAGGADFTNSGNLFDDFHRKLAEDRAKAAAQAAADGATAGNAYVGGIGMGISDAVASGTIARAQAQMASAQTADAVSLASRTAAEVEARVRALAMQGSVQNAQTAADAFRSHFASRMQAVDWADSMNAPAMRAAALRMGENAAIAASQGIEAGKATLATAWKDALSAETAAADAADQIIVNNAQITAQKKILSDKSSTAADRAQARITLRDLQNQNASLLVEQAGYGTRAEQTAKTKALLTSKALLAGLHSKDPDVRAFWLKVKTTGEDQLAALQAEAAGYGANTGQNYAAGLASKAAAVRHAALLLSGKVKAILKTGSPSEEGPFSEGNGPSDYGVHLVDLFVAGMGSRLGSVSDVAARIAAASMGAGMPALSGSSMPALYAPSPAYHAAPYAAHALAASPGGGTTVNMPITLQGLVKARDPMEIAVQARRFARLGLLSARPEPGS